MTWHSTFGSIGLDELIFRFGRGKTYRPFQKKIRMKSKGYSQPLQRVIVDFGADVSFGKVRQKLQEHYGIELPDSSARKITLKHADQLLKFKEENNPSKNFSTKQLIAEMDGSMVPIVFAQDPDFLESQKDSLSKQDRRKERKLGWKEAKLCAVQQKDNIEIKYAASLLGPADAGSKLFKIACQSGYKSSTKVHGVGDGALWIIEQMDQQFGSQCSYLIDYFHVCEYLRSYAVDSYGMM